MNKILISILGLVILGLNCFAQETTQNSVKLNLIATDKSDVLIDDLKKEELTLFIDDKPQPISSLEKQELPLIYGLAVDSSGSMRSIFKDILKSGRTIIEQNRAEDETLLISFISSDKITAAKSFSSDKNVLTEAINKFSVEGGPTALIDAIYLAVEAVAKYKKDDSKLYRRAVIVMTDGQDRDSFYNERQLSDLIDKENVQVFFIGLTENVPVNGMFPKNESMNLMKKIAQESGGVVISPKRKALSEAGALILPLIRTQYWLRYSPLVSGKIIPQKIEIKLAKDSIRKDVKFYFHSGN